MLRNSIVFGALLAVGGLPASAAVTYFGPTPYAQRSDSPFAQPIADGLKSGLLDATTDFSRATECDALILCVPTPLSDHHEPDLSYVLDTLEVLLPYLRKNQVISLESTTYPGTTEEELRARIERFEEERASQAAAREREERLSIVEQAARDRPERFALALDAIETNKHTVMEAIELAMSQRPDLSYGQALTNLETYLRAEHDRRAARLARLTQVGQDVPAPGVTLGQPQDETGSQAAGVRGITNQMSAERGSPRHGEPKSQYDLDREEDDLLAQAARLVGRRA